jgi:selenocysteine lyase/cysteine desulfurase
VHRLAAERDLTVRMVAGAPDGSIDLAAVAEAVDGARLLVVNAVSNVLGTPLPVAELARIAHDAGALLLVDAAQLGGHCVCDVAAEGVDLFAFTGHKGLLGPQGTGGLWVRDGLDVQPFMAGGTGGNSLLREMPPAYPDHLEAGSFNGPGLAGLLAGLQWLEKTGIEELHRKSATLKIRLRDGLHAIDGVDVLSPACPEGAAIVTVVSERVDAPTLSSRLDREHGVLTRAGLHCAPEVHRILGTDGTGAVRFSVGWATNADDVDRAIRAVETIVGT